VTSGIRVGTPAATTRGLKEKEMAQVASWIARVLREGEAAVPAIKAAVTDLMKNYPLYT
jgi:glycine hydroxymethyltransferase